MHGIVVLLRSAKRGVSLRLACVGYCAEHYEDALDAALDGFRGHGHVVTFSVPETVRPNRQVQWRRATVAKLSDACQEMLASSALLGAPSYPDDPVPPEVSRPRRPETIDLDQPRAGDRQPRRFGSADTDLPEPPDLLAARRRRP